MTLNDLTVDISHLDKRVLVEDWEWLVGQAKLPILVCAIGDAFLQDTDSGEIYFLNTAFAESQPVAEGIDELKRMLADSAFVMDHFEPEMVQDLRENGVVLKPGEVYSFKKPLVLGGEPILANVEPMDIEVHFSLSGQIHEQVKDLPDGATLGSFKIG